MDSKTNSERKKPNGRALLLGTSVVATMAIAVYFLFVQDTNGQRLSRKRKSLTLQQIPFDGNAALEWVKRVCDIGPRVSGTPGMKKQQEMLVAHFRQLGGQVEMQEFTYRHPQHGEKVSMANLIVRWHPERQERAR